MTIYGIDVHPVYQAGLNIEQVRAEGFDFIAVKLSEGTDTYPGQDWLRRAKACGLLPAGYHYLQPGNENAQAQVFAGQLRQAGVSGMLDAEALAADGKTPTLTIAGIRKFLNCAVSCGVSIPLLYLPNWYWQRIGSPDLTGLPRLWASSYVGSGGYATAVYESVTPRYWAAYGGLRVTVLQFTDRALVAGQNIDANAFMGTRNELAAILSPSAPPKGEDVTIDNIPVTGTGTLCLGVPVGKASAITAAAWIGTLSHGPAGGTAHYWYQDDIHDIGNESNTIIFNNGRSTRWVRQVPDGTTMIRVDYNFPSGGTVCIEAQGK